jgi:hypothetical protein
LCDRAARPEKEKVTAAPREIEIAKGVEQSGPVCAASPRGQLSKPRKLDRFALRLSIRSFYPKRLLQDAQKKIGVNPRPSASSAFY